MLGISRHDVGIDRTVRAGCLVAAPVLYLMSTFFWESDGGYGVTGGALLGIAMVPQYFGLAGVLDVVGRWRAVYASLGSLVLLYGCMSGVAFAVRGFYVDAFSISHEADLAGLNDHAWQSNVLFFWPGPLFPLSLVVLAVVLSALRLVPWPTGAALAIVGVLFPAVSIFRFGVGEMRSSTLYGVFMFAAFAALAWEYWGGRMDRRLALRTAAGRPSTD